ncbi:MAG: transketolase [Clostridiales bacterium]
MYKYNENIINTIRVLSSESIQKAKSGHPGLPLGTATLAYTLWAEKMRHSPSNPNWLNRDRFILSAGHGSMLLYSLLYLFKYGLTLEDLKEFRQHDSLTPGHPEYLHTKGVEATTGPLGQGFANGVGMAIAEAHLAAKYNKDDFNIIDHYTYVLSGDGCMMEGITNEAASLAGTLGLDKLIVIYDSNKITIEGSTDLAFTEDVGKRFEALNWQVINVEDGNNPEEIMAALTKATNNSEKPSIIVAKTIIGYGSEKAGLASAHGEPLGDEVVSNMKKAYGFDSKPFSVPNNISSKMDTVISKKEIDLENWNSLFEKYKSIYPDLAKELQSSLNNEYNLDFLTKELIEEVGKKPMATRSSSGSILQTIASNIPSIFGGSADLSPSNKSHMNNREDFSKENRLGSNMHFGVREHAMGAVTNGISLHGGLKPYASTFFVFSDYMKGSIRMSAIMKLPVTYILTHDSIGVGEDGPTHQPIEHLAALRSIPDLTVFRPADDRETIFAWETALNNSEPTALILTRQNLAQIDGTGKDSLKGAYIILKEQVDLELIIIATGSELEIAYEASKTLQEKNIGVRLISMPSWELFENQSDDYKESILPKKITKRLSVEAASSFGWHKYVGLDGYTISIDKFGISSPAKTAFETFGFTTKNVLEKALKILK